MKKKTNKKILEYPVIFEPAVEGGCDVRFPDFPGCVTFGKNFEEAQKMAEEALSLWIEALEEEGENISNLPRNKHSIISRISVTL